MNEIIQMYDWVKANLLPNETIRECCLQFCSGESNHRENGDYLGKLAHWTNKHCSELVASVKTISEVHDINVDFRGVEKQIAKYGVRIGNILMRFDISMSKFQSMGRIEIDHSYPEYFDDTILETALKHIEALGKTEGSWFKWIFYPNARSARRFFASQGFPRFRYRDCRRFVPKLRTWQQHWRLRNQITRDLRSLTELDVPVGDIPIRIPLGEMLKKASFVKAYSKVIEAISALTVPPSEMLRSLIGEQIEKTIAYGDVSSFKERLEKTKLYLEGCEKLDKCKQNAHFANLCSSLLAPVENVIRQLTRTSDGEATISLLKALAVNFDDYHTLKKYEQKDLKTLKNTCLSIREKLLKGNWIPALEKPDLVIKAFRLSSFIKADLLKNPDDINEVATKISQLKQEAYSRVKKIIDTRRKLSLKEAESNPAVLNQITRLNQILKRKRKTYSFVQLREQINYERLLRVFPSWVMSIDDVARIFPLKAGLFDYLIVDEASQCNQATALHLAYRSKRMIVVGDGKQMKNPNTQFLGDIVVRLNLSKHRLDNHPNAVFWHGRNSLLDLAIGCQDTSPTFLNEHFRSEPPIFEFSNRIFYDKNLKILTPFRRKRFTPCMEIKTIDGAFDDPDDTKQNILEAKSVIAELIRIIDSGELEGDRKGEKLSIGILSPFRRQAILLDNMVRETLDDRPHLLKEHEITTSTVDGFQGDERDVILYSFRYAPNSKPGTINAIQRTDDHSMGRLNVAFSRARRKVVCFISTPRDKFPKGLIRDYLDHVAVVQRSYSGRLGDPNEREKCQSDFERDVFNHLVGKGLTVYTQVPCAGFFIDFVVIDQEGRRLAVECDGEFHYEDGDLRPEDYQRQDIIERYGWVVHRIPSRRYYRNPDKTSEDLLEVLGKQETDEEILNQPSQQAVASKPRPSLDQADVRPDDALSGISPLENKILRILSEEDELPVYEIAKKASVPREDVFAALGGLLEKGCVESYFRDGIKVWRTPN